jgi:hypothetical protein
LKNHHPPLGLQQKIAANPSYYIENIELLRNDIRQYNIKHIAILFGPTGIKDNFGNSLTLHGLDTDGEIFDIDGNRKKLIEELKTRTMVIKTRKPWGHLVLWFEHSKHHIPIQISDCFDQFHALEIKCQSNARADVPPSTHRNDENFEYYHDGLEKVAVLDGLYDRLVDEDLRDCILPDKYPYDSKRQGAVAELNIIKPNLRDGYGIRFESSHRPESGLSEISIKIDKETFENAVNYKNRNENRNNSNSASNAYDSYSNSEDQAARSEKKDTSNSDETDASNHSSQPAEEPARDDVVGDNDNNSVKNKFGLGAEAEVWDNESYDDEDDD